MENMQRNGNYEVQIWYNGGVAFFKRDSNELFENSDKQFNILVYIDEDRFENSEDFDMGLAVNLARRFNVVISTDYNAELAEKADVIINKFTKRNQRFLDDLSKYGNGSRLFVSDEDIESIDSRKAFR